MFHFSVKIATNKHLTHELTNHDEPTNHEGFPDDVVKPLRVGRLVGKSVAQF